MHKWTVPVDTATKLLLKEWVKLIDGKLNQTVVRKIAGEGDDKYGKSVTLKPGDVALSYSNWYCNQHWLRSADTVWWS